MVCDFGTLWTKAALVGPIAGVPRLIATVATPTVTAADSEAPDLLRSTEAAKTALERRTGLQISNLVAGESQPTLRILPVGSAARPLDVLIVAPEEPTARRLAKKLRGASYLSTLRSGSSAEFLAPGSIDPTTRPDAVVLVEGDLGFEASQLESLAQLLERVGPDAHPVPVLYCRPENMRAGAQAVLQQFDVQTLTCDLTQKGSPGVSVVRRWLNRCYTERSLGRMSGVAQLGLEPNTPFLSSLEAQAISTRYAGISGSVLSVDVGASHVAACYAQGDALRFHVLSGLGVGKGVAALYERVGEARIRRWLPFEPRPDEIRSWTIGRSAEPAAGPLSLREALIEQACVRESLRLALEEITPEDPPRILIGSGALARGVSEPLNAILLLDALTVVRPNWRRVQLAVDTNNLLVSLGVLSSVDPDMAAQAWEQDSPRVVAKGVAARGAKRDMSAVLATLRSGDTSVETAISGGMLHLLSPPLGESASVELRPQGRVRVAGARSKRPVKINLKVSSRQPLPQLLLDTRASGLEGEGRVVDVARYLESSGALTARELDEL